MHVIKVGRRFQVDFTLNTCRWLIEFQATLEVTSLALTASRTDNELHIFMLRAFADSDWRQMTEVRWLSVSM